MSRRFVAKTAAQLAAWRSTALDALDLVGLLIDGVHNAASEERLKTGHAVGALSIA